MSARLDVGCRVKIVEVPPAVFADDNKFPETTELFHKALGRSFEVRGVNEQGFAELWVNDDGSEDNTGGGHSIWVEPECLGAV